MSTTTKALKDNFSTGGSLLILIGGMEAVSRMIAEASVNGDLDHAVCCDAAYLLAELASVARSIVEDAQ
ncbi:hypothetical protein QN379_02715 [Glaciimonas sp. Gout2]|uniref:hypothetical protein n=1 Tax=unclassified Glaciimonas TaxID=2644401 RepID=UPI002B232AD3|nr:MULTISPECIES: hypothetical protein [unclassified Glaciimonas]MEB0011277.1 hypothetical protein [Glaciimonas sp. Cout2]MEB0080927.1 hypothetical protein [Glaciimonas sp. Gout2]